MTDTTALIPSYEPDDRLVTLSQKLSEAGFSVLIIDDGSGVSYSHIFQSAEKYATVLSYEPNCGKGHALKYGFDYLEHSDIPHSIIVTLDSDGQHTPTDAIRCAKCAALHPDALTLGVRSFGKTTPLRSRFGNSVTRAIYRISSGRRLSDTQTGLRAFGAELLPFMLEIDGERYEYEMNMLMECASHKISFFEIPIETIYENGNKGSHFRTIRDSFLVYGRIFKFALSSLSCFVIDYLLYSLLTVLLAGLGEISIPISNVAARIVSAGSNFAFNKLFVFKSRDSVIKTGAMYFVLAVCILSGNTLLLNFMTNTIGIDKYIAKLITEVTFFILSWLAQRFIIFRRKKSADRLPPTKLQAKK